MAINERSSPSARSLEDRIRSKDAVIAVIGLGYVGLPLAVEFAQVGFPVYGIDIDLTRIEQAKLGESYIEDVPSHILQRLVESENLRPTVDFGVLAESDVVVICVQTPFTPTKDPDLTFIVSALHEVRRHLHPGQLVILQSTTYPGTTEEVALPILSSSQLRVGTDYFLAFSPERVDPHNAMFPTREIPKVVGGITPECAVLATALFRRIVSQVHAVSSAKVAELTKLLENVFRSVNVALVNELASLCHRMGVNIWEVIEAAATKPFGFMTFYPGPGVGGHCIPIDPYYLSWKAKEYDFNTRFIDLAAEINENMPYSIADRVTEAINIRLRKSVAGARIMGLGVAYKRGVGDIRESPAIKVLERLKRRGATINYHDPHVPAALIGGEPYMSEPLTPNIVETADCTVVLTDHDGVDYRMVVEHAPLVFDARNATRSVPDPMHKIVRL